MDGRNEDIQPSSTQPTRQAPCNHTNVSLLNSRGAPNIPMATVRFSNCQRNRKSIRQLEAAPTHSCLNQNISFGDRCFPQLSLWEQGGSCSCGWPPCGSGASVVLTTPPALLLISTTTTTTTTAATPLYRHDHHPLPPPPPPPPPAHTLFPPFADKKKENVWK